MNCIICGKDRSRPKYPDLGVVSCVDCGHVFYNAEESSFEPSDLYNEAYFINGLYGNYEADAPIIKKNFLERKKEILRYSSGGRLLEIGSAYGLFLDCVRDLFDCMGFEMYPEAARYAREKLNLNVTADDFLKYRVSDVFDVVCLFDTIEHLIRPDLYFNKIRTILKKGGYVFFTTGDISALLSRAMGRRWRLMHSPLHIHYFSRSSVKRFCEKRGFNVISIKYIPVWRSLHQMLALMFGVKRFKKMAPVGIPINTFDIMSVVAQKQD